MKIVAVSDLHGNLPELPECDVLVIAGDICPDFMSYSMALRGDKGEQRQRHWLETDFREWLKKVPAKEVVGIAGNHDFVFEHRFLIPKDLRWHYLRDEAVEIDGVRFYGSPWVPNLPKWAFHGSDEFLYRRAEAAIEEPRIDVLVVHGPPYGYADKCGPKYGLDGLHVGDRHTNEIIAMQRPKAIFCGHIHEGFGEYNIPHNNGESSKLYNVAFVDEVYEPMNRWAEVDV